MKRFRTIVLLCSLVFLGACSSTTFFYNRLDFILPWYLDDYVELDREQKKYLDSLLSPFLAWHRSEELPRYVEILQSIESSLDRRLAGDDVAAISLRFEQAWLRLQDEFLDWLLELGASLSDEQIESFLAQLWEKQEDYEDEYLDRPDKEFREDSYEGLRDSLQDYLGRLDKDQREVLRVASAQLIRSDSIWLTERAAWLRRLEIMLQREPGWEQQIREAVARRDEHISEQYLQTYEHNLGVVHHAIAVALNSRSDKQDRHLRRELSGLKEDLQTLIEQGKAI